MSSSSSLISKLKAHIEKGGNKKKTDAYEEAVVEGIEKFAKEESFYELPTNEILKIIGKSEIEDIKLLCEVVSRMSENKGEESTLLLNVIKSEDATLEECIKILSKFKHSQICRRTSKLFNEDKDLPERDFEDEVEKLKKENEKLQIETKQMKTYFPPVTEKPPDFESDICVAAEKGKLTSVQYLVEQLHADVETKSYNGNTPINIASKNGHLEIVKYLYETCHAKVSDYAINDASSNGYFELVKYLYEMCHAKVLDDVINIASSNGHLDIVKYLYETCHANVETKNLFQDTPLEEASYYGHLEVVRYLYETCHAKASNYAISNAAKNGHIDVVRYLYETCHAGVGADAINHASRSGNLELVKYLYEICHAKITEEAIEEAETEEIKEYLHSKKYKLYTKKLKVRKIDDIDHDMIFLL